MALAAAGTAITAKAASSAKSLIFVNNRPTSIPLMVKVYKNRRPKNSGRAMILLTQLMVDIMRGKQKNNDGFTVLELLTVIVCVVILVGLIFLFH